MQTPVAKLYEFGEFQLDTGKRLLRRLDGTPVPLTSRVFDTLLYMVRHHDAVLDKERIMEAVWPDSIVEENNLAQAISKLRQVFGETPGSHSYIVTVPGRGYRFVAEVNERPTTAVTVESQIPIPNFPDAADTAATTEVAEFVEVSHGRLHRGFQKNSGRFSRRLKTFITEAGIFHHAQVRFRPCERINKKNPKTVNQKPQLRTRQ